MSAKARAAALGAALVVGLCMGQEIADDPVVKYRVIHDTETVTETIAEEVPVSECKDLVRISRRIQKAGRTFDLTSTEILDIISDLRIALAAQDPNQATDLENRLRRIDGTTLSAIESLGLSKESFDKAASACTEGSN